MMIQAIVLQFAEDIVDMSPKDLHQKVADAKGKTFLDQFNGALCRGRIAQLEALLNYQFDLQALIDKPLMIGKRNSFSCSK